MMDRVYSLIKTWNECQMCIVDQNIYTSNCDYS